MQSDLEERYQEQLREEGIGTQKENTGKYESLARPVTDVPIQEHEVVPLDNGFQVSSLYMPAGVGFLLAVAVAITFLLTRRAHNHRR